MIGFIIINTLNLDFNSGLLVLLGSIIPDLDFFFDLNDIKRNHRSFLTHYPLFWLSGMIISITFKPDISLFFLAGLIHTLVDVVDWDVFVFKPFSERKVSILKLDPVEIIQDKSMIQIILKYYSNREIIFIELLLFILFIVSFGL